ncbi:TetR/AcrR family transcriptional regulator [Alginatibacterium sediminis]|uniref:TetR/AcrR family transcriptional regulator n=1 Tax=Alginatibacterium sediminis TaxID=2164068 RepID=A0A420E763_9ALTE|nr:TetR/AcrR family transcriptional regulator [Alginatibacterium sediminis]RKF14248.1 TetR/AcrR family transcriptional regulator [Alginatibacterium sediminis]
MNAFPIPEGLAMRKKPQQARTKQLVDKILLASAELLEQEGLAALNTNSIAERAQIDIASLYRFFRNKEAILFALSMAHYETLHLSLDQATDKVRYTPLIDVYFELLDSMPKMPYYKLAYTSLEELFISDPNFQPLFRWSFEVASKRVFSWLRMSGCSWDDKSVDEFAQFVVESTYSYNRSMLRLNESERESFDKWMRFSTASVFNQVLTSDSSPL